MKHHLITGGAGFIGSALAHRLIREGHRVTVLDRFSRGRGKYDRLPREARTFAGDIRNPDTVGYAARDADVIWHLAYVQGTQTFYAEPKTVIDVALRGIMNVLDVCEQNPGKDLILMSSSEAYQMPPEGMYPTDETVPLSVPDVTNPRYSYGGGKIASELAVLAYAHAGLLDRTIIVRPHNIYGPDMGWDHVIPQFATRMMDLEGDEFQIQGTGEETRSFCYIGDCIDGLMLTYKHGENGEIYHLGNPHEEYRIRDVAVLVSGWFGRQVRIVPGELPKGSPTRRKPSVEKLGKLGYLANHGGVVLPDGLHPTLQWYAEHYKPPVAA